MMSPVLAMAIGIVVMLLLIIFTRMHAFPALIISAVLIAILAMPVGDVINTVTTGFGNTMKSIGIVIGFGCIMGIFLEKSGAAKRMALTILKLVGVKNCDVVLCDVVLGLTGFVVSIPVFCDSGFVILSSLAKEFSRLTKKSMVWLGGILGMGLYITHFMVPPTPGPLAVVSTFNENGHGLDLGMYIIYGLLICIGFIYLYPMLHMITESFMTLSDLQDSSIHWIPSRFETSNYDQAVSLMDYWTSLWKSFVIAGVPTLCTLVSCSITGYGLARYKFLQGNRPADR